MGRIPNFSNTIFPKDSLPMLNLTSTIGLVLFLFLVALELDVRIIKRNYKASLVISAAGLVLPLGLGAALGVPIYHQFINPDVNFGYFVLFTAVAIGITAFPVLCRILTELKLLDTNVGAVTLAAGVGNDVRSPFSQNRSICTHPLMINSGRRLDFARSHSRLGQRRKRSDCPLGSANSSWFRHFPPRPRSMGIPLARSPYWQSGKWPTNTPDDDRDHCFGLCLGLFHRHHWCSRHFR